MNVLKKLASRLRDYINRPLIEDIRHLQDYIKHLHDEYTPPDSASQLALGMVYRQLLSSQGEALPSLKEVGFKVYSQTDEDGILLFIFSIIGITNKKCVEICAGDGMECNTANLIINHGWSGLLFDGNPELVGRGKAFYGSNKATYVDPPAFICSWIKRDTINGLLEENGFKGEIDLLSLDLDGVDYWIWDALEIITPRVVVLEYQDIIGPEKSLAVPYADDFNAYVYPTTEGAPNFCGASLAAFVKLGRRKGYRFVGCNRSGYNAFFVRNGVAEHQIPEIPIADCFHIPKVVWGMKHRWPTVSGHPWVEV